MSPHKGINYDTGFEPFGPAHSSRKAFDVKVVRREMQIIASDLHCTHIRITGADPERMSIAARLAVEAGMSVWFSPFPSNLFGHELLLYFIACAAKAEEIRQISADTVFVLGCELSLFDNGFLLETICLNVAWSLLNLKSGNLPWMKSFRNFLRKPYHKSANISMATLPVQPVNGKTLTGHSLI